MPGKQLSRKDEPSDEVEIVEEPNGIIEAAAGRIPRRGNVLPAYVATTVEDPEVVAEATHRAIIEEVLAAESLDDVLNVPEPENLSTYVGRHLRLDKFKWNDSEFDTGPKVYFTLTAWDYAANAKVIINTGEQRVMAQVWKLNELGELPTDLTVRQAKRPNRFNRFPLVLVKWEAVDG